MSGALARARALLARPGGWIEGREGAYHLRLGRDRRSRVNLTVDEATFRALIAVPGLKVRPGGGWMAMTPEADRAVAPPPGRPGLIEGERLVMQADGAPATRAANLGESPIAWLARRKDRFGRPWLTPAEVAAGERLRLDAEAATWGPSVTMRWDALPRAGGGGTVARMGPADRVLAASARVEAALVAIGPRLRPFVSRICITGSSLQLAEQSLSLRRHQGRALLKQGLAALAVHYGIG